MINKIKDKTAGLVVKFSGQTFSKASEAYDWLLENIEKEIEELIIEEIKNFRDDLYKHLPDTEKPYKDYGAGFKDCHHQTERMIKNRTSLYIKNINQV